MDDWTKWVENYVNTKIKNIMENCQENSQICMMIDAALVSFQN